MTLGGTCATSSRPHAHRTMAAALQQQAHPRSPDQLSSPRAASHMAAQQPALWPNALAPKTRQHAPIRDDGMDGAQPQHAAYKPPFATGTGARLPAVQNKEREEGCAPKHSKAMSPSSGATQSDPSNTPRLSERSLCAKCLVTMCTTIRPGYGGHRSCV